MSDIVAPAPAQNKPASAPKGRIYLRPSPDGTKDPRAEKLSVNEKLAMIRDGSAVNLPFKPVPEVDTASVSGESEAAPDAAPPAENTSITSKAWGALSKASNAVTWPFRKLWNGISGLWKG